MPLPPKIPKPASFRRLLLSHKVPLNFKLPRGRINQSEIAKSAILSFVQHLQTTHPFKFMKAARDLENEKQRWEQERLGTQFMLATFIESAGLPPKIRPKALRLAQLMSEKVGKGGDNWVPGDFVGESKLLAMEIGREKLARVRERAEEMSILMSHHMNPVNSVDHTITWGFRYVGQLLRGAIWESAH